MGLSRERTKGRSGTQRYVGILHRVWRHPRFVALTPVALKLLIDMLGQYNGLNNGDLHAAWSVLSRDRGWNSKDTLHRALKELMQSKVLFRTRQGKPIGGTRIPSLYAVTWLDLDPSDKYDPRTTSEFASLRQAENDPWKVRP